MKKYRIVLTGGGSAGHVVPNLALAKKLLNEGWDISYIGSYHGMERELVSRSNIRYFPISTGKLRRYFSWRNFIDPFLILNGMLQAFFLCYKLRPQIVFAKGGFVSFPVVISAWLNHVPVIIHESDLTPGLANKLCFPFVRKICVTFAETKNFFKKQNKVIVTGSPLREELFLGNVAKGLRFCGFLSERKVILVFGGGLGAAAINDTVRAILPNLLKDFQIIHICGKNKVDTTVNFAGYRQFEYVHDELPDLFACADIVISRAGANSLYELLSLYKPHILIPLSTKSSRGDQIANANYFAKKGLSEVIFEHELTPKKLYDTLEYILRNAGQIIQNLQAFNAPNGVVEIYKILEEFVK